MKTFVLIMILHGSVNAGWGNGDVPFSTSVEFNSLELCEKAKAILMKKHTYQVFGDYRTDGTEMYCVEK